MKWNRKPIQWALVRGTTYKITARVVYTSSPKPKMMMFKVFISEDGKWSTILLAEEIK